MSGRHSPRIDFGTGVEWAAVNLDELALLAQRDDVTPLAMRLVFASIARADRHGHAPYRRGELAEVLGKIDTTNGEIIPATKPDKAVRHAIRLGMVSDDSTVRCIRLPQRLVQNASAPVKPCIHSVRRR